nr:MAG TPA: zinc finger homeobox protein 4 [Bacteriophage sp.]
MSAGRQRLTNAPRSIKLFVCHRAWRDLCQLIRHCNSHSHSRIVFSQMRSHTCVSPRLAGFMPTY